MAAESYISHFLGDIHNVDLFLSVSNFHKSIMVKAGVPEDKLRVLHNFVDTDKYKAPSTHDGYYLYFGRIEKLKGLQTLVSAFSDLNYELIIVGEGGYQEEMEKQIKNIENINYLGFKEGSDLLNIISRSRAVIVPSEWYENCPMNILEAKSMGRPVIGANIGGIPELIQDDIDGYIFEPANVNQLKSAVIKAHSRFEDMSLSARKDAVKRFSNEAYYVKLMDFYSTVIK
jgi:glycosyltransferase involved in cell wall biosynthesis